MNINRVKAFLKRNKDKIGYGELPSLALDFKVDLKTLTKLWRDLK